MGDVIKPTTPEQLADAVAWAAAERRPLQILGSGAKRRLGRPVAADTVLDLSALTGIVMYEPDELVMAAKAGTPLAEVEAALAERHQQLAFEVPDFGPLLGVAAHGGTIGGTIACNLAGPRRVFAGAARDHILGAKAVSGGGEAFKTGGRVVKNVTGFDLPKLLTGSYGTLAVMSEITVKVLPAPEKVRTILIDRLDDATAVAAMTAALQSCHDVSAAAHLPASVAARSQIGHVRAMGGAVTAIRVEGPAPSVAYRCEALRGLLAHFGPTEELHSVNSNALWREVRDVAPFVGQPSQVWRLVLPPSKGAEAVAMIADEVEAEAVYDRGGGLVWLTVPASPGASAEIVRAAAAACGGQATLFRADEEMRASLPVFQPQPEPLARLTARVKQAFDPLGILNPGRMYPGF